VPGFGEQKVNAAFAFGGPELLVETLEQETGVRIDGYLEIGFAGFASVVDAVGGVELCLDAPLQDDFAGIDLPAGCQLLAGPDALGVVRSRYADADGDLGRVQRQRQFLSALAERAASPAVLLNPVRLVGLARTTGGALATGDDAGPVDLARTALALRRATGPDGVSITVPVAGYADTAVGNVVLWDEAEAERLWDALRTGEPIPRSVVRAQR
jgi:LCP family protein required for cell wall assembly